MQYIRAYIHTYKGCVFACIRIEPLRMSCRVWPACATTALESFEDGCAAQVSSLGRVYVCMYVCVHECMYVCMYVCICMYVNVYTYVYIYV